MIHGYVLWWASCKFNDTPFAARDSQKLDGGVKGEHFCGISTLGGTNDGIRNHAPEHAIRQAMEVRSWTWADVAGDRERERPVGCTRNNNNVS